MHIRKMAFTIPSGLWQYQVLPSELSGVPATFQHLMDNAIQPDHRHAAVCLYDVLIQPDSWADHLKPP